MQALKQCIRCSNHFNNEDYTPKLLVCQHIICITCALLSFQTNQSVTCPLCQQITSKNPALLVTPFLPSANPPNQEFCQMHEMKKILFCKDDKENLCVVCAQYTQIHKGHQIVDIQQEIQELTTKEIPQVKEKCQQLLQEAGEFQERIYETKQNLQKNTEKYIEQINEATLLIIETFNQLKEQKIEELTKQLAYYQDNLNLQLKNVMEKIQTLKGNQIEREDNLSLILEYFSKIKEMEEEFRKLERKEVELT